MWNSTMLAIQYKIDGDIQYDGCTFIQPPIHQYLGLRPNLALGDFTVVHAAGTIPPFSKYHNQEMLANHATYVVHKTE